MIGRTLAVTIDTEVDKDSRWAISDPVRFRSVTHAIPEVFTPLFETFGVVPTYLLSPEVMEDPACAALLREVSAHAELGTHLHAEMIAPERRLDRATMAGQRCDALQGSYGPEIERAKLVSITDLFTSTFGRRPTSFRAGRFALSATTLSALAGLGYVVDSSVTPGLVWRLGEGRVDYRRWPYGPTAVRTAAGTLLEVPVTIVPGPLASIVQAAPALVGRAATAALRRRASFNWLRPSWTAGADLVRTALASTSPALVLMLHSMEVVPGASPYAADPAGVERIVHAMRDLFAFWAASGNSFAALTVAARALDIEGLPVVDA